MWQCRSERVLIWEILESSSLVSWYVALEIRTRRDAYRYWRKEQRKIPQIIYNNNLIKTMNNIINTADLCPRWTTDPLCLISVFNAPFSISAESLVPWGGWGHVTEVVWGRSRSDETASQWTTSLSYCAFHKDQITDKHGAPWLIHNHTTVNKWKMLQSQPVLSTPHYQSSIFFTGPCGHSQFFQCPQNTRNTLLQCKCIVILQQQLTDTH